jgi:hypothetical protein
MRWERSRGVLECPLGKTRAHYLQCLHREQSVQMGRISELDRVSTHTQSCTQRHRRADFVVARRVINSRRSLARAFTRSILLFLCKSSHSRYRPAAELTELFSSASLITQPMADEMHWCSCNLHKSPASTPTLHSTPTPSPSLPGVEFC